MPASEIQSASLSYYAERQVSQQWRALVLTLVDEMYLSAGQADAGEFLRHVGSRMAAALPLGEQGTLKSLEAAMNRVWADMDWGWVSLTSDGRSVELVHGAYPRLGQGDQRWLEALAALLEGIYQQWFVSQGETGLVVRCTAIQDSALLLRCSGQS